MCDDATEPLQKRTTVFAVTTAHQVHEPVFYCFAALGKFVLSSTCNTTYNKFRRLRIMCLISEGCPWLTVENRTQITDVTHQWTDRKCPSLMIRMRFRCKNNYSSFSHLNGFEMAGDIWLTIATLNVVFCISDTILIFVQPLPLFCVGV